MDFPSIVRYLTCTEPSVGFPGGSEVKASACNVGDLGSIPGLQRFPGEGNGNPPQDRVEGVKSRNEPHVMGWKREGGSNV